MLLGCLSQPVSNIVPVGDIPDGLHIIRPHILVLQVVGVFPHVNPEQWDQT